MAYTYSKIATYTVGSGGIASVSFLNIPQTYTDLVVKISARNTAGNNIVDAFYVSINGTNPSSNGRVLEGSGSGTSSFTSNRIGVSTGPNATASSFNNLELYLPNYTSGYYKSFSGDSVTEQNATAGYQNLVAGIWENTSPITNLVFTANTFAQYSTFHLYGVKAEL